MRTASLLLSLVLTVASFAQRLNVLTTNIWSGSTYEGTFSMSMYETPERREARTDLFISELKRLRPDVVFLQEVNPVGARAGRIADELNYDVVTQRVLAGMKAGPIGIPVNLNEGLAILARKELQLTFLDVWILSDGFGAIGDGLSFHFSEENIALVAQIRSGGRTITLVNTHFTADVPDAPASRATLTALCAKAGSNDAATAAALQRLAEGAHRRMNLVARLASHLQSLPQNSPLILGGDLNAEPDAPELDSLAAAGYRAVRVNPDLPTWDPAINSNIRLEAVSTAASSPFEELEAWYDSVPRRIDHLFLNHAFGVTDAEASVIPLQRDSLFASDHFGVLASLDISSLPLVNRQAVRSETEFLPILSYDTDVGFGYGVKFFFLNQLDRRESFDLIAFNSTKGERWYRLVWSLPDFELRQGTVYPFALDITIDYDKYLKNSFFGIGAGSRFGDRETYTREPFEAQIAVSRGFTEQTVLQVGVRYRFVRNFNFTDSSSLRLLPSPDNGRASSVSFSASLRHDTRNSFINPSRGIVAQAEAEYAPSTGFTNASFTRAGLWFQWYTTLFYPKTVLAWRIGVQAMGGRSIPVQMLLPIGGNTTLRGSPQDRFLDRANAVTNVELRFPLWWRFAGVAGWDAGRVWSDVGKAGLVGWRANPVIGLRFLMDTFIVRADLGLGSETTGFYLNFGQLF